MTALDLEKVTQIIARLCGCRKGEDYKQVLEVNVVGPFLVTKHFLPQLQKKSTRVVVNTSSVCGSISGNAAGDFKGLMLPYNSSKAAINMRESYQPLQERHTAL